MKAPCTIYVCLSSGWLQVASHRLQRSAEKIARTLAHANPANRYCVARRGLPLYSVAGRDAVQQTEAK